MRSRRDQSYSNLLRPSKYRTDPIKRCVKLSSLYCPCGLLVPTQREYKQKYPFLDQFWEISIYSVSGNNDDGCYFYENHDNCIKYKYVCLQDDGSYEVEDRICFKGKLSREAVGRQNIWLDYVLHSQFGKGSLQCFAICYCLNVISWKCYGWMIENTSVIFF